MAARKKAYITNAEEISTVRGIALPPGSVKAYMPGHEPVSGAAGLRARLMNGGAVAVVPDGKGAYLICAETEQQPEHYASRFCFEYALRRIALTARGVGGEDERLRVQCFEPFTEKVNMDFMDSIMSASYGIREGVGWMTCLAQHLECYRKLCGDPGMQMDVIYSYDPLMDEMKIYGTAAADADEADRPRAMGTFRYRENGDYEEVEIGLRKERSDAVSKLAGDAKPGVDGGGEQQDKGGAAALRAAITEWQSSTDYAGFCRDMEKEVIGQDGLRDVLLSVWVYLENVACGGAVSARNNVMIAAPSGTGKTETYRALRHYFRSRVPGLPVILTDATKLTTEGFRGMDTVDLLADLVSAGTDGVGIVFLDEFDKRIEPQMTSSGENVGREAQNQLLATLEGSVLANRKTGLSADTSNTLFVAIGSFDLTRKRKEERLRKERRAIGFARDAAEGYDHYSGITREDVVSHGGTYELAGRFPIIVNYGRLSREAAGRVVEKFRRRIESSFRCSLELSDGYRDRLAGEAGGRLGLRGTYDRMLGDFLPEYRRLLEEGRRPEGVRLHAETAHEAEEEGADNDR